MTADELKQKVEAAGIRQHRLAHEAGLSIASISRQLNGERPLNTEVVAAYRRLLQLRRQRAAVAAAVTLVTMIVGSEILMEDD